MSNLKQSTLDLISCFQFRDTLYGNAWRSFIARMLLDSRSSKGTHHVVQELVGNYDRIRAFNATCYQLSRLMTMCGVEEDNQLLRAIGE